MATETLLLDGVVSGADNWTLVAGASKVAACQSPDDDSSSYIQSGTSAGTTQRFTLADPSEIGSSDTINVVTLRIRHQRGITPAGTIRGVIYLGGAQSSGTTATTSASWVDQSDSFSSRPSGGAWTLADLSSLEVAVQNGQTRNVYCTTVEIVVDYTPYLANHTLAASGVNSGAPVLGGGLLSQLHLLSPGGLVSGSPICAGTSLSCVHSLAALGLACGEAGLGTPALQLEGANHALVADAVAAGAPVAGSPLLSQLQQLDASGLLSGVPAYGTPSLSSEHNLAALGLAGEAPDIGTPALQVQQGDTYTLSATGIESGSVTWTAPVLSQVHWLVAHIQTDPLEFPLPTLAQGHSLAATSWLCGVPALGSPGFVCVPGELRLQATSTEYDASLQEKRGYAAEVLAQENYAAQIEEEA